MNEWMNDWLNEWIKEGMNEGINKYYLYCHYYKYIIITTNHINKRRIKLQNGLTSKYGEIRALKHMCWANSSFSSSLALLH